ncbi:MAG: YgeY family selenium metabolism-linked hydrolase [bacterium]|nr:YgeY family selenium metabolism-linked hydrolase [bacterium]
MNSRLDALVEELKDSLASFVQEIVAIPSTCGDEGAVVNRLREEMVALGYDDVHVDAMGNLIGRIGHGARILAIDGHCDTVGPGECDQWSDDPYSGILRGGAIFGRGASDQKGGLAAAIYAGKALTELGLPESCSVWVVASVLEEDAEGACWNYILEHEPSVPEAVVLTEPTNLTVAVGQRGRMEIRVTTAGQSCHGSAPDRGVNAIYRISPIVSAIEELHHTLESDSILGKGSVTVTDIRSTAPSLCAVPDTATIHLDRRLTEREVLETAVGQIEALSAVAAVDAKVEVPEYELTTYTGLNIQLRAYHPPWLMVSDDPLVRMAASICQDDLGIPARFSTWQFSTNGVATRGTHGIPTIGFGPGEERFAHAANEQVQINDLVTAMKFYAAFALAWSDEQP